MVHQSTGLPTLSMIMICTCYMANIASSIRTSIRISSTNNFYKRTKSRFPKKTPKVLGHGAIVLPNVYTVQCNKSFIRAAQLKTHLLIHIVEKLTVCT